MADTSKTSVTFSETSTPPVSSAAFQVRPKSLRLTSTLPDRPTRSLPNGSRAAPSYSKSMTTGLVTSLMVRSPATRRMSASGEVTSVEAKRMVGYFSTSKKSPERRWPSRSALLVSMESAWIVTSMRAPARARLVPLRTER